MTNFVPGQRWISETEPELGLGTIIAVESNRVTCLFIASNERRMYAADNAPLARVKFSVDEVVESADGWKMKVSRVNETGGIITYSGVDSEGLDRELEETELDHFLQFNKPLERLFAGQLDSAKLFELRHFTLNRLAELEKSPVYGLCGARTSLIPHQLFIAHEVANRHAPRVLLADEVGLGKTIEAGLILHHQLLTGRASRVLILVPAALQHQWLVEMRRRFNLRFSLFDDDRYGDADPSAGNPFLAEQLVLCSIDFMSDDPERAAKALDASWDICVVDEAHHLRWSSDSPSEEYLLVESLAKVTPSLLLLTATPEQLGKESHFARLRLLDPDRFYSYDAFLEQESHYLPLAQIVTQLSNGSELKSDEMRELRHWLENDRADELLEQLLREEAAASARNELISLLLDRHGTGRILFRNTRATVKGFPPRELHVYPLPWPDAYPAPNPQDSADSLLFPERPYRSRHAADAPPWWKADSKVPWLIETLRRLRPAKILVICAKAQTAIDLEEAIRTLSGIGTAVFHEALTIIERDRAAAWFADTEEGAQVLVCSEIGSEGRNFQFAHHLILFDLPLSPDQLEQRIGRLDRIGQTDTIKIHVPYFEGSAQAVLFDWFDRGLEVFNANCPAGPAVFARLREELLDALQNPASHSLEDFIARSRSLRETILEELHDGRDRLLELNSCRHDQAEALEASIREMESSDDLWNYLDQVFDAYGVSVEEHSEHCHILLPGDHMRLSYFPELPEDGVTATVSRSIALAREDMLFLTWEHPMVRAAMDLILNNEHGNSSFSVIQCDDLESGQLLLEAVFQVECAAPRSLGVGRFMHQTVIRQLVDGDLNDLSGLDMTTVHMPPGQHANNEQVAVMLRAQRRIIERMLKQAEQRAEKLLPAVVAASVKEMLNSATTELKRLAALRKVNPFVRQEEVDYLKENTMEIHSHLQSARLRLDAVRILLSA